MFPRPSLAYVIDPRFPGGTSAAVAAELRAVAGLARISVHAIASHMFSGRGIAAPLQRALDDLGFDLIWDAPQISADLVVLHNPAFLKFQTDPGTRILARRLIVVAHENFLRPGGAEGFDVARCLDQIDRATLALEKFIAPISPHNRATIAGWFATAARMGQWSIMRKDWFNICDFPLLSPNPHPRDRRGRHSRPGFEKFPSLADMDLCFPHGAESNVILGGDSFAAEAETRPHWTVLPFQSIEVAEYFDMIDFMIYFTAPTWRESFGRVLAEGIAAGKVVISDPETAATFGGAVLAAPPAEVDALIAEMIAVPGLYQSHVAEAQTRLAGVSAAAFRRHLAALLPREAERSS